MRVIIQCDYNSRFNGKHGTAVSLSKTGSINVLMDDAVRPISFHAYELINESEESR